MADRGHRRELFAALNERRQNTSVLDLITPELARSTSISGTLLLHEVCELGAPACVVAKVASLYPDAASKSYYPNDNEDASREGICDLPVFLVCNHDKPSIETVESLIDVYPGCLKPSKRQVPLFHYCCRLKYSREVLELQRLVYHRSIDSGISILDIRDLTGFYPIHHLAQGRNIPLMQKWIVKNPERFTDDQYPCSNLLHYAVEDSLHTGHNPEMVYYLANNFPMAVETPNLKGELPIHLALWPDDRDILLHNRPFTILHTARDGMTPIGRIQALVERIRKEIEIDVLQEPLELEEYAEWINEEHFSEIKRLLVFLRNEVLPPIQEAVLEILQANQVPSALLEDILVYAVPHYEEATYLDSSVVPTGKP